jgi:hypothetical protein
MTASGPLARPAASFRDQAPPRRGDLTSRERVDLAWLLEDYAELLETCAVGVDDGGSIDKDTLARAARARDFANRLK